MQAPVADLDTQVATVIVRQARLATVNGGSELTVRLTPEHLGPLHVRIALVEGALSVGLTAANADTQQALERALPQLRGALADAGLRLDRVDVGFRDSGGNSSGNGSAGQRGADDGSAGRQDGRPDAGGDGAFSRQSGGGREDGPSFADLLFDQDGRAFLAPLPAATRRASFSAYRAYGAPRSRT